MHKQNCMLMILAEDLQLVVSYVPQVREKEMVRICTCLYVHLHVCVTLPMIAGAWFARAAFAEFILLLIISDECKGPKSEQVAQQISELEQKLEQQTAQ